jgi:hypothetical protein
MHMNGVAKEETSTMVPPATEFEQANNGWWRTDSGMITSGDVVGKVNADNSVNLNEFGLGVVASADLVRFTKPSMVVNDGKATDRGLRGDRKPKWSSSDEAKEGSFIADYQSMLLRSFADKK